MLKLEFTDGFRGSAVSMPLEGEDFFGPAVGRGVRRREFGDLSASFHSCTDLTASVYSVGLVGTAGTVRLALWIQGCFSNLLAEIRSVGFF
jgi:hypothetical protein